MSEEEKNKLRKDYEFQISNNCFDDIEECIYRDEQIKELKELVEKQQKELDKLKNKNKDLLRKLRNRVKQVKKLEKYALYKKEFSRLNKELEKKDKIIRLIAEAFRQDDIRSVDEIIEYFTKKAEKNNG